MKYARLILIDEQDNVMAYRDGERILVPSAEVTTRKKPEDVAQKYAGKLGFPDLNLSPAGTDGFDGFYFSAFVERHDKPGFTWVSLDKLYETQEMTAARLIMQERTK